MKIESDDYYGIILSAEYLEIGQAFLDGIIVDLQKNERHSDIKNLKYSEVAAYKRDTRCLIGFALTHDDYEFGVGGLCHAIGHQVKKPLQAIEKITGEMKHEAYAKILKMKEAVESAPPKVKIS